jgi:DnaJ-domain-containing protein 1
MWVTIGIVIGVLMLLNTGNIFLFFWPILIGYFLNSISLQNTKNEKYKNRYNYAYLSNNRVFINSFSILSAKVTIANGVNKMIVNQVKNFTIEIFGMENAKIVMRQYKYFVENGINRDELNSIYNDIRINFNVNERDFLVKILFKIEIYDGMSKRGLDTIKEIADNIGANFIEYEIYSRLFTGGGYYQRESSYDRGYYNNHVKQEDRVDIKECYKILGVSESSSDEEIKKRYRTLCKEYHPDKTINHSEKLRKDYEDKLKKIIEAYQEIRKKRGIT